MHEGSSVEENHKEDDNIQSPRKKEHDKSKFGVRDYFTSLMKGDKKDKDKKDRGKLMTFYDTIFKDTETELENAQEQVSIACPFFVCDIPSDLATDR